MTKSHWNWEKTYRDGLKKDDDHEEEEEEVCEHEIKLTHRTNE